MGTAPKKIFLYNITKEKIDFKAILKFIESNFGKIDIQVKGIDFVKTKGLLFDFIKTEEAFDKEIPAKFKTAYFCHIAITDRLVATYDEFKRLHIRAAIFGYPSIISISGIVEGPARPKQYYIYKQKYAQLGIWELQEDKIKKRFKGRFIDYRDRCLTEVLKGYIAQALFFQIINEPFCKNKSCRLFNAHWQEDLIYSQIKKGNFCKRHKRLLGDIKVNNR